MDRIGAAVLAAGTVVFVLVSESPWAMWFVLMIVVGARAGLHHDDAVAWQTIAGTAGVVFVLWWLLYGRSSEFPGIAYRALDEPSGTWFFLSLLGVALWLVYVAHERPAVRAAWTTGAWLWWALTMWGLSHEKASSDWNIGVPVIGLLGLLMIGACEAMRSLSQPVDLRRRRGSQR